jgi:hypothetical protein
MTASDKKTVARPSLICRAARAPPAYLREKFLVEKPDAFSCSLLTSPGSYP